MVLGQWTNCCQQYLLSSHFQLGLQLAVCILLTSLPTFVRALNFPHACFTPVLMIICLISMSVDGHVGTKAQAAFSLLGETWVGSILAGLMVSLAKPLQPISHSVYLAVLCITSSLGLALLIAPRAGPKPLTLWPHITLVTLIFSAVVLYGHFTWPVSRFWRDDVGGMCLCGLVAALAVLLVSLLVLPSLAAEHAVCLTCSAIRGGGHAMTRLLSLLLDPTPHEPADDAAQHPADHTATAEGTSQHQLAPWGDSGQAVKAAADAAANADQSQAVQQLWMQQQQQHITLGSQASSRKALHMTRQQQRQQHEKLTTAKSHPAQLMQQQQRQREGSAAEAPAGAQEGTHDADDLSDASVQLQQVQNSSAAVASSQNLLQVQASAAAAAGVDTTSTNTFDSGCSYAVSATDPNDSSDSSSTTTTSSSSSSSSEMLNESSTSSSSSSSSESGDEHDATGANNMAVYFEEERDETQPAVVLLPMMLHKHASQHARNHHQHVQQHRPRYQWWGMRPSGSNASSGHGLGSCNTTAHAGSAGPPIATGSSHLATVNSVLSWGSSTKQQESQRNQALVQQNMHEAQDAQQHQQHQQEMEQRPQALLQHHHHSHHHHMRDHRRILQQKREQDRQSRPAETADDGVSHTVLSVLHKRHLGHRHHKHHLEKSVHAAVLHTPAGPVAVLGPSVDELRPLISKARGCLQRAVLEPHWVGWPAAHHKAGLDIEGWGKVLAATDQLLSMVSTLEAVVLTASRRLIHPTLHSSTERVTQTAMAVVGPAVTCCSDLSAALALPSGSEQLAAVSSCTSGDWAAAEAELSESSSIAMREYWEAAYSKRHLGLKVARTSEILAIMFVWVMIGGLIDAAQQLEQAATQLISKSNAGSTSTSSDGSKKPRLQCAQLVNKRVRTAVELVLLLPVLCNMFAMLWALVLKVAHSISQCLCVGGGRRTKPDLPVSSGGTAVQSSSSSSSSCCWVFPSQLTHAILANRARAAAFKLWLAMSILLTVTLVVADPTAGYVVWPLVSEAVRASPAAGVIAFVLAWHDWVESTSIRVGMRIVGTTAGTSIAHGMLSNSVLAASPALLILLMAAVSLVLAPLASPSFHLRLTTALITISVWVTVVCQYDIRAQTAKGSVAFFVTRVMEVTLACLWTGIFNHLVLPWSSARWSIESMASSYTAAANLLQDTCHLQFAAYAKAEQQLAAGKAETDSGATTAAAAAEQMDIKERAAALRKALQSDVVTPLVAVQNELTLQTNIWQSWGPRHLVPRKVRKLFAGMLELADRITALQVVIGALDMPFELGQAQGMSEAAVAAANSLDFISDTIMRPVHGAHAQLLQLVQASSTAVQQHLQQDPEHTQQLKHLQQQLHEQWQGTRELFATQRHVLHHALRQQRAVVAQRAQSDDTDAVPDQVAAVAGAPAAASCGASKELARRSLVGHMWWLHAAAHYQQQLAYQHAFDSVMGQLVTVIHVFALC